MLFFLKHQNRGLLHNIGTGEKYYYINITTKFGKFWGQQIFFIIQNNLIY